MSVIRKRFYGPGAQANYGIGRKLLGILHQNMRLGGLEQGVMRRWVDGVYYEVTSTFGLDEVRVFNTSGQDGVVAEIEHFAKVITTSHVLWANANGGSVDGWFGQLGEPELRFQSQKDAFAKGLKEGGATGDTAGSDADFDQLRISVVSPATHLVGSFNKEVYAYLLKMKEFEEDYNVLGEKPFKSINIANWYVEGPRQDVIDLFDMQEIAGSEYGQELEPATMNVGSGFWRWFFNGVRFGSFIYNMFKIYFRKYGNPWNANFDDDVKPIAQTRYLAMDLYAGTFVEGAIEKLFPGFDYTPWPHGFEETYGVGELVVNHDQVRQFWYTSAIKLHEGEPMMQMPPDIGKYSEKGEFFILPHSEHDETDGFWGVSEESQNKIINDLAISMGKKIKKDRVSKMVVPQGATFDPRTIKTTTEKT